MAHRSNLEPITNLVTADAAPLAEPDSGSGAGDAAGELLTLSIDEIQGYEHDPRLAPNPERARLKASIRASGGLAQPLTVTRRPGADHYTVQRGGNTRLSLLHELRAETPADDTRFDRVRALYKPFTSELDVAVFHDQENNLRGDLSFIEQAFAKVRQYELFCAEVGKTTVTAFAAHMRKAYGDSLSPKLFYRQRYAADILYEWIPTILVHGRMSLCRVREWVAFRRKLYAVWRDHGYGSKAGFEAVIYPLLARQDEEFREMLEAESFPADARPEAFFRIDYARLRREFQHELAEMAVLPEADYQTIGLWIGAALNSADMAAYERGLVVDEAATPDELPAPAASPPKPRRRTPASSPRAPAPDASPPSPAAPAPAPAFAEPASLRARCHAVAQRIAERNGFAELLEPLPEKGCGFILKDIFPETWWDDLSPAEIAARATRWWLLALCSRSVALPRELLLRLPESSMLRDAQLKASDELLTRTMGSLGGTIKDLDALSEADWDDFFELWGVYRQLFATATGREKLW